MIQWKNLPLELLEIVKQASPEQQEADPQTVLQNAIDKINPL